MREELLPGEDAASMQLGDAEHWNAVYGELVRWIEGVLSAEVEDPEVAERLEAKRELFQRRLRFWEARRRELQGKERR